ncbi:MAG: hypothetical protein J6386_05485 [Candidatus Synoicihabitans palmerolidicus]|nr:hypothetical protein [Candidatus Synoicihabitans palmerolidicus]
MIIIWLTGGLGNQMFQYAAGLALAERRRTVLKLDVSWYRDDPAYEAHNQYALSCLNITEQFATTEEVKRTQGPALSRSERWSIALAKRLRLNQWTDQFASPGNRYSETNHTFSEDFINRVGGG